MTCTCVYLYHRLRKSENLSTWNLVMLLEHPWLLKITKWGFFLIGDFKRVSWQQAFNEHYTCNIVGYWPFARSKDHYIVSFPDSKGLVTSISWLFKVSSLVSVQANQIAALCFLHDVLWLYKVKWRQFDLILVLAWHTVCTCIVRPTFNRLLPWD